MYIAKEAIVKTILKKIYDDYVKEKADIVKEKLKELKDAIKDAVKEGVSALEDIIEDFLEWIRSRDPVRMMAKS